MLVTAAPSTKASASTFFREVQPLNIEEMFFTLVQPLSRLAGMLSRLVQSWKRPEKEVTLMRPLNKPEGRVFREVQPLNIEPKLVAYLKSLNRSAGMVSSEAQSAKMELRPVTFSNPSKMPAGISFSEEQPWNTMLRAWFLFLAVLKVCSPPDSVKMLAGTDSSRAQPLKQDMKVSTLLKPLNRCSGTVLMFV